MVVHFEFVEDIWFRWQELSNTVNFNNRVVNEQERCGDGASCEIDGVSDTVLVANMVVTGTG